MATKKPPKFYKSVRALLTAKSNGTLPRGVKYQVDAVSSDIDFMVGEGVEVGHGCGEQDRLV